MKMFYCFSFSGLKSFVLFFIRSEYEGMCGYMMFYMC